MTMSTTIDLYLRKRLEQVQEASEKEPWQAKHEALKPVWLCEDVIQQLTSLNIAILKADTEARLQFTAPGATWNESVIQEYEQYLRAWLVVAKRQLELVQRIVPAGATVDGLDLLVCQIEDAEWALADDTELFNNEQFAALEDDALSGEE